MPSIPQSIDSSSSESGNSEDPPAFFKLSAELRNTIYHLALTRPEGMRLAYTYWDDKISLDDETKVSADLLRTCRQINAEATPVLYGANTIDCLSPYLIRGFTKIIGHSITHLRHLSMSVFVSGSTNVGWELLAEAKSLEKITITNCDASPWSVARALHPFHKSRGWDSEKKRDTVDLIEVTGKNGEDLVDEIGLELIKLDFEAYNKSVCKKQMRPLRMFAPRYESLEWQFL